MKQSAGILVYKKLPELQVFLVHPGGPYFKKKDEGAWTIPKGEYPDNELPLTAAIREFYEETGVKLPGNFHQLKSIKQKGGKIVHAWITEHEIDAEKITSNNFSIEWPPKSGVQASFPEVDKGGWFGREEAKRKINIAQVAFIDELFEMLYEHS